MSHFACLELFLTREKRDSLSFGTGNAINSWWRAPFVRHGSRSESRAIQLVISRSPSVRVKATRHLLEPGWRCLGWPIKKCSQSNSNLSTRSVGVFLTNLTVLFILWIASRPSFLGSKVGKFFLLGEVIVMSIGLMEHFQVDKLKNRQVALRFQEPSGATKKVLTKKVLTKKVLL